MNEKYLECNTELLHMLDAMAGSLQEKKLDIEALGCMEQGLMLKRRMFGPEVNQIIAWDMSNSIQFSRALRSNEHSKMLWSCTILTRWTCSTKDVRINA